MLLQAPRGSESTSGMSQTNPGAEEGDSMRETTGVRDKTWPPWVTARPIRMILGILGALSVSGALAGMATAAPTQGGTLRVGLHLEPTTLDPHGAIHATGVQINKVIFESLVQLDQSGTARPLLAASWTTSPDGKVWTFKLRDGVKFHDGTVFDADAVKFSLDRVKDPATGSLSGPSFLGPVDRVEVVDRLTVRLTYPKPYPALLDGLETGYLAIVSPAAARKFGKEFGQHPVGTGPYTFESWTRGQQVILKRNPAYSWAPAHAKHQGPGYLESIVFRFIPEHQTRLAAFERGELDLFGRAPGPDVGRLREDKRFVVHLNMFKGEPTEFLVNAAKPPTNEVAVRQAMLYAINRASVVKAVTFGISTPAYGPLKPSIWPYWKGVEEMYRHDPAKARELLEKAGWKPGPDGVRVKDGRRLSTIVNVKDDPQALDMLQLMQADLKQVGMDLEIRPMALAASEDLARKGENGLTFMDWRGTDPDILTLQFHSKNIGGWNFGYLKDPTLDKLLDDAREEMNRAKRQKMYEDAQRYIMEQGAVIPLFNQVQPDPSWAYVKDLAFDANTYFMLYDVWLDK
jgi:peptide/nickel transport system substrate-binding protein